MSMPRQLVLVGDSAFAEIAYEYFTHDSPYEVVAFSVERAHMKRERLFDLPVVPFEDLEARFSPDTHDVYVAIPYTQLNRLRTRLAAAAKAKGYTLASYVSSRAFVWRNVELGEHVFIFEDNTLQPFVKVGDNVVMWSGNHVGHHSTIGDNVFIASHAVLSGFVVVEPNCFLGVNCTLVNNITIGRDAWVGPGAVVTKDVAAATFLKPAIAEAAAVSTLRYFKIEA